MSGQSVRLIVNADDFGRSDSVTFGVVQAFRQGLVSSASIVAAGPSFPLAVRLARENPGLDVGLHLALDEYPAISKEFGGRDSRARFLIKFLLPGLISRGGVEHELDAQIEKCFEAGLELTHLDGHGHCHIHPRLTPIVARLGKKHGIPMVRLPAEPLTYLPARFSGRRLAARLAVTACARLAQRRWRTELRSPDAFYGFSTGGNLTPDELERIALRLKPGLNELMVHVGTSDNDPFGLSYRWFSSDLRATMTWTKQTFEERFGVKVISRLEA